MHLAQDWIRNENLSLGWTTSLEKLRNSAGGQRAIWGELVPLFFCGELCRKLSEVHFFSPITLRQSLPSFWSFDICGTLAPSHLFGPSISHWAETGRWGRAFCAVVLPSLQHISGSDTWLQHISVPCIVHKVSSSALLCPHATSFCAPHRIQSGWQNSMVSRFHHHTS